MQVSLVSIAEGKRWRIYLCEFNDTSQLDIPLMDSAAVKDDEVSRGTISDKKSPRSGRCVCQALAILLSPLHSEVIHTIRPAMRSEDEEYSVESYPNERCAHCQTNR